MGFTKNTGTYSKPSGGIPQSDLAEEVIAALRKAEQYTGTVTEIKVNGNKIGASGGVVDLGNLGTYSKPSTGIPKTDLANDVQNALEKAENAVSKEKVGDMDVFPTQGFLGQSSGDVYALPNSSTGDEDDVLLSRDTVKTINGESIFGSGNITIGGGSSSSSGSGAYSEVNHGTSDTTFTLTPNTFHVWDEVSSLTLTLGAETSGVANEYLFQFTSGSEPTTLSLPDDIKWTGGEAPAIEADKIYQISILKGLGSVLEFANEAQSGPIVFYVNGIPYDAMSNMTWEEWVNSEYNTNDEFFLDGNDVNYWTDKTEEDYRYVYSRTLGTVTKSDIIVPEHSYLAD
jgi:hypothetical protein